MNIKWMRGKGGGRLRGGWGDLRETRNWFLTHCTLLEKYTSPACGFDNSAKLLSTTKRTPCRVEYADMHFRKVFILHFFFTVCLFLFFKS